MMETNDMPDEIAQLIAEAFPDYFDLEGESYADIHKLQEVGKKIEASHKADMLALLDEVKGKFDEEYGDCYTFDSLESILEVVGSIKQRIGEQHE